MRSVDLKILACPVCQGPLETIGDPDAGSSRGALICVNDGTRYPVDGGIPNLLRPDRVPAVDRYARSFSDAWAGAGWGHLTVREIATLPHVGVLRRHASMWRQKARALEALLRVVNTRPRTIVDVGAGVGWLSNRLAQNEHRVFAVDILADARLGLRAADVYGRQGPPFNRIRAEMAILPFATESVDTAIFNASLHYALQPRVVLKEASRILQADGSVFVLSSPVHSIPASARRAEADSRARLRGLGASEEVVSTYNHFHSASLHSMLSQEVGPVREIPYDSGFAFRVSRRLKGIALGLELASFPILAATKPRVSPGAGSPD